MMRMDLSIGELELALILHFLSLSFVEISRPHGWSNLKHQILRVGR